MGVGKFVYLAYYKPVAEIRQVLKTGIRRTARMNKGRRQMQAAAPGISEVVYPSGPVYTVHFLTGKKYWFQTAFCLHSLQVQAKCNIQAVIVDDGSFDDDLEAAVMRQFPTTITVVRRDTIERLLDEQLPIVKFPVLRHRRLVYPHLRKLTDVHVLSSLHPKLVLDSDMLFFRHPAALLAWLKHPDGFLFMRDIEQSYGYSDTLMCALTGTTSMPERLNVGVAGIGSEKIDWVHLENWTKTMLEREGSSYLQEQALTAMLAANEKHRFLDEADYRVLPSITGNAVPECLHHYVAEAKYDYFVLGWRLAANLSTKSAAAGKI